MNKAARSKFATLLTAFGLMSAGCGQFHAISSLGGPADSAKPAAATSEAKADLKTEQVQDSSEGLTDDGEALLLPDTFVQAREKFAAAVKLRPENPRAQFYLSAVEMMLEIKGILTRVKPVYNSFPEGTVRYNRLVGQLEKGMPKNFTHFFRDGRADITSYQELNEFMDRVRLRVYKMRETLRSIRDSEFTLNLPQDLIRGSNLSKGSAGCALMSFGPVKFKPTDETCQSAVGASIGLNRADFESLLLGLGYYQSVLDLWTAYSFNSEAFLALTGKTIETRADAQALLDRMFTKGADGHSLRAKPFSGLRDMANDSMAALRYQLDNQATLCPMGYPDASNRKGYLLSVGVCVNWNLRSDYERSLMQLEAFLAGRPIEIDEDTIVDYNAIADEPPSNLRDILPVTFDDCGHIVDYNAAAVSKIILKDTQHHAVRTEACKPKASK